MQQGRVGVCGHGLGPLRLQRATLHISPNGIYPNHNVANQENECVALGVKYRYVLMILFSYLFLYSFLLFL